MNCNCIQELQDKLSEHYTKVLGTPATVTVPTAFAMTPDSIREVMIIPIRVRADKATYRSANGKIANFHPAYCPSCGVSTAPKKAEPESETVKTMIADMNGEIEG